MLCRRLLYLLSPSLSWRTSCLLPSQIFFSSCTRGSKVLCCLYCLFLLLPRESAPWIKELQSFHFLCLKMCMMSQNPSVASHRIQLQCTSARKGDFILRNPGHLKKPNGGNATVSGKDLNMNCEAISTLSTLLFCSSYWLHFVHSLLVALYPQGRTPVPGARTLLD